MSGKFSHKLYMLGFCLTVFFTTLCFLDHWFISGGMSMLTNNYISVDTDWFRRIIETGNVKSF